MSVIIGVSGIKRFLRLSLERRLYRKCDELIALNEIAADKRCRITVLWDDNEENGRAAAEK